MHIVAARLAEPLAAVRTLVRLVFGVHKFVVAQVILPAESFAAHVTRKWPLVCVCTLVDHQVVRLGKFSVAKFTDETFFGSA